jgi:hypothetical protein
MTGTPFEPNNFSTDSQFQISDSGRKRAIDNTNDLLLSRIWHLESNSSMDYVLCKSNGRSHGIENKPEIIVEETIH